jgi:hypothetical protein
MDDNSAQNLYKLLQWVEFVCLCACMAYIFNVNP